MASKTDRSRKERRGAVPVERTLDRAEVEFFAALQSLIRRERARLPSVITRICAVDAAYRGDRVVATASVFERGRLVAKESYSGTCSLPYVSGLFYLREGPFAVEATKRLKVRPQLVCFDAHGAAHPRSAGLATVCGMVLGIPSVGIAKSRLVGRVVSGGGLARIVHNDRVVGFYVETNGARRYWSPGYAVGLRELRSVIRGYAPVCLLAMSESHRTARKRVHLAAGGSDVRASGAELGTWLRRETRQRSVTT